MKSVFTLFACVFVSVGFAQVPENVPEEGLTAWWSLNGDATDLTGNGNDGLVYGAITTEDRFGNVNAAFDLDGLDDFVLIEAESSIDPESDYTWSLWFNSSSSEYNGSFLFCGTWFCKLGHDLPGLFYKDEQGNQSNTSYIQNHFQLLPTTNNWHHLVIRKTLNVVELFLDGIDIGGVASYGYSNFSPTNTIKFGNTYNDYFEGQLDDIGFWDRALNPEEIFGLFGDDSLVAGCTDPSACNFNLEANQDDGSCEFGCNHCGPGTFWDESSLSCLPLVNPSDLNGDGCVDVQDFVGHLAAFGEGCNGNPQTSPWQCGDPFEYQGYEYETVQIEEQCWFAENLRSENYENGDAILSNLSDSDWASATNGALSVYGEDSGCEDASPTIEACDASAALNEYGRLYNWFAVADERSLCPSGWHIPQDNEWSELEAGIGMAMEDAYQTGWHGNDEALALKASAGWFNGGNGANSSGFNVLPSGDRFYNNGFFGNAGVEAYFWSSTDTDTKAWSLGFLYDRNDILRIEYDKNYGFSIRCIQDAE